MSNKYYQRRQDRARHHFRRAGNAPPVAPRVTSAIGQHLPFWPTLLTIEQVGTYLGMHPDTFLRHAPVSPIRLGARLLRWRRSDLDRWVDGIQRREGADHGELSIGRATVTQALQRAGARSVRMKAD